MTPFPIDPQGRDWTVGEDEDGNYVLTVTIDKKDFSDFFLNESPFPIEPGHREFLVYERKVTVTLSGPKEATEMHNALEAMETPSHEGEE
jgi:hypothetical protein